MDPKTDDLKISAYREGEVPGTHSITYSSEVDEISIEHKAHSRQGFALGQLLRQNGFKEKKVFSL